MSESKRVTREELALALHSGRIDREYPEGVTPWLCSMHDMPYELCPAAPHGLHADAIFDLLPADPPASETVEAYLRDRHDINPATRSSILALAAQDRAEARAAALEAAGTLDVERLRTADANVAESNPSGPYRWQVAYWHAVAAEYARLAEVADKP